MGDPAQNGGRDAADSENAGVREKNGNKGAKTIPSKKDSDQCGDSVYFTGSAGTSLWL